jgi:hypothetical protein
VWCLGYGGCATVGLVPGLCVPAGACLAGEVASAAACPHVGRATSGGTALHAVRAGHGAAGGHHHARGQLPGVHLHAGYASAQPGSLGCDQMGGTCLQCGARVVVRRRGGGPPWPARPGRTPPWPRRPRLPCAPPALRAYRPPAGATAARAARRGLTRTRPAPRAARAARRGPTRPAAGRHFGGVPRVRAGGVQQPYHRHGGLHQPAPRGCTPPWPAPRAARAARRGVQPDPWRHGPRGLHRVRPGWVAPAPAAAACSPCAPGRTRPQARAARVARRERTRPAAGTTSAVCLACAPGAYSSLTTGTAACTSCPAGMYTTLAGATGCTGCAAGTYSPTLAPRPQACTACAPGG